MLNRRHFSLAAAALPLAACNNDGAAQDGVSAPLYPPSWREGPQTPYAVQEIYPAFHDDALWIAGGFSPQAQGATERVIALNLAQSTWSEAAQLPTPSHHVHLASLNGVLHAIGGFMGGDTRTRWICTPRVLKLEGGAWVEGPALPKPIGEAVPLVHEGRIHLIGGRSPAGSANAGWNDQADVADHFVLTEGAAEWERAAPLPMARNSAAGAVHGGELHVISGRTVASGQTPAHHIYDPQTDTWRDGPAFPEPRGGLGAAAFNNVIVAGGGEIFEPGSVGAALYAYDSGWTPFDRLPTPRHGHGFVNANGALYALGGARRVGGDGTLASVDVLG